MELGFWGKIKKPIMVMAPMSGVTDEAFRLMFLKYGKPDVFWTEFVSAEGLFSKGKKYCLKLLEHSPEEKPIVAQLFGCNSVDFERASKLVAELGFDGIDINMGCPDRAIEKQGAGATLIKNPTLAKEIIRATLRGAQSGQKKIPVSVKTRLGYDKIKIKEWIGAILEEEPAVVTVHLRTRNELYFPKAHWELTKEILELRNKISPACAGRPKTLILGNGDIKSVDEAKKRVKETGLDGVMIGRAVVGDPWFFSDKSPSVRDQLIAIIEHAELFDSLHKEEAKKRNYYKVFSSLKKHFHASVKGFRGAKELRDGLMMVKNTAETKKIIKDFIADRL